MTHPLRPTTQVVGTSGAHCSSPSTSMAAACLLNSIAGRIVIIHHTVR
jgi:hypothetical protein